MLRVHARSTTDVKDDRCCRFYIVVTYTTGHCVTYRNRIFLTDHVRAHCTTSCTLRRLILDLIPLSSTPFEHPFRPQKSYSQTVFTLEMSSKENPEHEVEPQTPEGADDVSPQDDTSDPENQEQDGRQDGVSGRSMTMEERKEKMRQLRAKVVRRIVSCLQSIYGMPTLRH